MFAHFLCKFRFSLYVLAGNVNTASWGYFKESKTKAPVILQKWVYLDGVVLVLKADLFGVVVKIALGYYKIDIGQKDHRDSDLFSSKVVIEG